MWKFRRLPLVGERDPGEISIQVVQFVDSGGTPSVSLTSHLVKDTLRGSTPDAGGGSWFATDFKDTRRRSSGKSGANRGLVLRMFNQDAISYPVRGMEGDISDGLSA